MLTSAVQSNFLLMRQICLSTNLNMVDCLWNDFESLIHLSLGQVHQATVVRVDLHLPGIFCWKGK